MFVKVISAGGVFGKFFTIMSELPYVTTIFSYILKLIRSHKREADINAISNDF